MTNLEQLLDRVVKATGADREIDLAISILFPPHGEARKVSNALAGTYWYDNEFSSGSRLATGYTSSVDADIALIERVLPGWQINMHHYGEGSTIAEASIGNRATAKPINAPTLPLALVAAALSALIVKEKAGE